MAYAAWSVVFGEQPSAAKWNILGTNDASFHDGTGIGAVLTNSNLSTTAGALGGTWASWTPTWANLTIGNATVSYAYMQVGKSVFGRLSVTLGSTSSMGSDASFTLPVTAAAGYASANATLGIGVGEFLDNGTAAYPFVLVTDASKNGRFRISNTSATYGTASGATSTVPFTWTTGDAIEGSFFYEAA